MKLTDYDKIIDLIEKNIGEETTVIHEMIRKQFGSSLSEISDFFRTIHPKHELTLVKYIRERKMLHSLNAFCKGETKETVIDEFKLADRSYNWMSRMLTGKVPKDLRKEGFVLPKPLYLEDILQTEGYSPEKILQDHETEIGKYNSIINELERDVDLLKEEKEVLQLKLMKQKKKYMKKEYKENQRITQEKYFLFIALENLRQNYGFAVSEILELLDEAIKTGKNLESLCIEALYDFRFELRWIEDIDDEYDEEPDNMQLEYEMSRAEAYNYYYVDDDVADMDPDPYECDDEKYFMDSDYSADAEIETPEYDIDDYCINGEYELGEDLEQTARNIEIMLGEKELEKLTGSKSKGRILRIPEKSCDSSDGLRKTEEPALYVILNDEDIPF